MSERTKKLIEFLASAKLAIALILALALVSVFGTFRQPDGRYDLYYQTPWFRLLVTLLCLNLTLCTLRSMRAFVRSARTGTPRRQLAARAGAILIHGAILLGAAGGVIGDLGFVGTLILPEGATTNRYFDWREQRDRGLPFEIRLDRFEIAYYPVDVRLELVEANSGQVLSTHEVKEGESFDLPLAGLRLGVKSFDPREHFIVLSVLRNGQMLGDYQALPQSRGINRLLDTGYCLRPVAFGKPRVKQLSAIISIVDQEQVRTTKTVRVNDPLTFEGISIYLTTYSLDKFGFWQVGLQLGKDPGEPLVLFASLLFLLGLALVFGAKRR